jgi:hypothetical protein
MGKLKAFSLYDNECKTTQGESDMPVYQMAPYPKKNPYPKKKRSDFRTLYIADNMLGIPSEIFKYAIADIDAFDDYVFSRVDSKLEVMVLLGMLYCMLRRENSLLSDEQLVFQLENNSSILISDGQIWFMDPWSGWSSSGNGPSSMSIVPQYMHKGRVRDFAIFSQGRDNGTPPKIPNDLDFLIEVDGYAVHNQRREVDNARDESADVPVFVFREEAHWPKTFWDDVVLPWIDKAEEDWSLSEGTARLDDADCPFDY